MQTTFLLRMVREAENHRENVQEEEIHQLQVLTHLTRKNFRTLFILLAGHIGQQHLGYLKKCNDVNVDFILLFGPHKMLQSRPE